MMQLNWRKMLAVFGVFLFLLIILLTGGKDLKWNAIALGGLMIYLWIFEVISIYVTALLPLILAVPLKLLTPADLASSYGNNNVYLFFGGFVMALALEKWHVHEQIARRIIAVVGDSKPRILLGFLLSTGILSMWISNTATALMMLPMAVAIIEAMPMANRKSKFSVLLLLSIAYAASIGGMATLVGSPPNTQMAGLLETNYHLHINFFQWMKIGLPVSLSLLFITFLFFYISLGKERNERHEFHFETKPWSNEQIRAMSVFGVVIVLWSFRDWIEIWTGWSYRDESAAVLGAILMFIVPGKSEKKPLLEWKDTEKLPWGILLLFGGGMALALMLEKNGVISEITNVLNAYIGLPLWVIVLVVVIIGIFATEIMSNLALVTIFTPVVAAFALNSDLPILQLCLPLALASSCAFMLPVGTPPNAIIFSSGMLKIHQMAKVGFVLNVLAVLLVTGFALLFL
jgi:solute carrier family 13 (sodium-dependent dicarboxylate transporter), member 2/3/5